MYDKLVSVGYNSPTEAIISGLDLLLKESNGVQFSASGTQEGTPSDTQDTRGDSAETRELRARVEEKEKQINDKNTEIEFLKCQIVIKDQQIEKRDADIKNLVAITTTQTYKAIEAPAAEKRKSFFTRVKEVFIPE